MADVKNLKLWPAEDGLTDLKGQVDVDGKTIDFRTNRYSWNADIYKAELGNGTFPELYSYDEVFDENNQEPSAVRGAIVKALEKYNEEHKNEPCFETLYGRFNANSETLETDMRMTLNDKEYRLVVGDSFSGTNYVNIKDNNGLNIYTDETGVVKAEGVDTEDGKLLMAQINSIVKAAQNKANIAWRENEYCLFGKLGRDLYGIKCSKESVETHITGHKVYDDGYTQTIGNVVLHNESNGQKVALDFVLHDNLGSFDALTMYGRDVSWHYHPQIKGISDWNPKTPITQKLQNTIIAAVVDADREYTLQNERKVTMDDIKIKFDSCEYDNENDVMTTTGKANINGKEYEVTFTEHDGKIPNVNISNTDIEMGYSNGSTIDGYGLETGEGKALYDAADTIYRAVFDAADDFQHRDPDAICARISYENKGIETEEPDIQIEEMSRNTGDAGDLVGVVRINEDTLRFCADRDGSIYSLMPTAAAMQDVRTVPISDEVKTALCDAIREGIVNYIEHEENPAKDMAYPPVAPDEIKGMSVDEVIEYCDWDMDEHEDGSITLESHSPAGEDLIIETTRDSLVDDLRAEAENFDPDEHAEMWVESRGTRGVPDSIKTLVEDAEAIQQKYFQLSNAVEMAEKMQEKARSNDMER